MRICEFVTSLNSGGAENFVRTLSRCLKSRGHDVTVLLLNEINPDNQYEQNAIREMEDAGIPVFSLGLKKRRWHSIRLFLSAMKFFRCNDFDIVHSHCDREDILSFFCRFLYRKKNRCVSTLHNTVLPHSGVQGKLWIFLHHHMLLSVFCGKEAYEANRKLFPMASYIANGIDVNPTKCSPVRIDGAESFRTKLLAVGRLAAQKNQTVMIDAMPHVLKKYPECGLLICGKGNLEPQLKAQIQKRNLEKNVLLLGERKDVPDLLHQVDFFVSSSSYEGLPIAVLEACAQKVPALLSPIPPHVALAENIRGCFCAKDSSPEALAELIISSIEQKVSEKITPEMWEEDMREYSIEKCCDEYLEIFASRN